MSLEGLNAILNKEEVIATRRAIDLRERPEEVDATYKAHVRTYVPMQGGASADERLSVQEFGKRFILQTRNQRAPRGYITADFGYGKTSTGLYIWNEASEANFVAVPPFQLNKLFDFVEATFGWVDYMLGRSKPSLREDAAQIYQFYSNRSLEAIASRYQGSIETLQGMYQAGLLNLELTPADILGFFKQMTDLVMQAGFDGLIVIADEVQQYLEPEIKSGKSDPIGPLFNLIQDLAALQNNLAFGLLLIIPQKELGVINDQRGDLIDRLRGLSLDLKTVYDQGFPARLWERLAEAFEFQDHADRMLMPISCQALGQIAIRSDLANGPRTVINTFRRVTQRYLETADPEPYSPIDLIDDFLSGYIVFDGTKRIQEVVSRALDHSFVKGNAARMSAVRLAAAFPTEGATEGLQQELGLKEAFAELIENSLGDLVIRLGDTNNPGTTLIGLDKVEVEQDWLLQTIREYGRNYHEIAALTKTRALRGFTALLKANVFKSSNWHVDEDLEADFTQNAGFVLRGSFPSIARQFPERIVFVQILFDDEIVRNIPLSNNHFIDLTMEFRLRRYLDVDEETRRDAVVKAEVDFDRYTALLTLNTMGQSHRGSNRILDNILGKILDPEKRTPLFLLSLHGYFSHLQEQQRVPKDDQPILQGQFQPALLDSALSQLLTSQVGANFDAADVRLIEVITTEVLQHRYSGYYTLMAISTWRSSFRNYTAALRQLSNSLEKQGDIPVQGTKEEIAKYFALAAASFDGYATNYSDFIEVVKEFSSKGKTRGTGIVRFRMHPLEEKIMGWLIKSSEIAPSASGQKLHYLRYDDLTVRIAQLGYKEPEIEQIIEIMQERDLVSRDKTGNVIERPQIVASYEEIAEAVAELTAKIDYLQKSFPEATELGEFAERGAKLRDTLARLKRAPDPKALANLANVTKSNSHLLENMAQSRISGLRSMLTSLVSRLTLLKINIDESLQYEVSGTDYAPPIEQSRTTTLFAYEQVTSQIQQSRESMELLSRTLENQSFDREQLPTIAEAVRASEQELGGFTQTVQHLNNHSRYIVGWVRLIEQQGHVVNKIRQLGTLGVDLASELDQLNSKMLKDLDADQSSALSRVTEYERQMTRLWTAAQSRETETSNAFNDFQSSYRDALVRIIGLRNLWSSVIYSPLDPEGVRNQVYEHVQSATNEFLDDLDDVRQRLLSDVRSTSTTPALQNLPSQVQQNVRDEAQRIISEIEEINERFSEAYEAVNQMNVIKSFSGGTSGQFYMLLIWIADTKTQIDNLRKRIETLREIPQRLELSPEELEVYEAVKRAGNGEPIAVDLVDIRSQFRTLDDNAFWEVLRMLWEKQHIQILMRPSS